MHRRRLGMAVALSLVLHAALLTVWMKKEVRQPRARQPATAAMQWVTVMAPPPAAPPPRAPKAEVAAAQVLPRSALGHPAVAAGRSAHAPTDPAPAARAAVGIAGAGVDGERHGAADRAAPPAQAAVPSQTAPSSPLPASAASAPWEADSIARALQRERTWQRRHGSPATDALTVRREAPAPGLPMGHEMSVRESVGAGGGRVSRVQGAAGTYCVRVPSANRLPELGAAPRLAPVTTCP
ncbi:hypothetical protein [Acidovorax sp. Root267]|uniref:hypothetical protein n=1 Tax=Acidovorax sp. Root267 TaxID=1736505 RepID=UPI0011250FC6|nr:hypothetical protein [Acidovorax sp. Root267]